MSWIIYDRNRIYLPTKQCTHTLCSWWRKPDQPKHITLWNCRIDSLCKPNKFAKPYTILCGIYTLRCLRVYICLRVYPYTSALASAFASTPFLLSTKSPISLAHKVSAARDWHERRRRTNDPEYTHKHTQTFINLVQIGNTRVYTHARTRKKKNPENLLSVGEPNNCIHKCVEAQYRAQIK